MACGESLPYRFTSKELDPETGYYSFAHRTYDPKLGRWLSADPILKEYLPKRNPKEDNENIGSLAGLGGVYNPPNLDLYQYTHNNPVRYIDADGNQVAESVGLGVIIGSGAAAAILTGAAYKIADNASKNKTDTSALRRFNRDAQSLLLLAALLPLSKIAKAEDGSKDKADNTGEKKKEEGNTNPYNGPVDREVNVVDRDGNTIPVGEGEEITRSPNDQWVQVRDRNGNQTGTRIDGPHNPETHDDPRALAPHAHRPGVTNQDGTPWLPILKK